LRGFCWVVVRVRVISVQSMKYRFHTKKCLEKVHSHGHIQWWYIYDVSIAPYTSHVPSIGILLPHYEVHMHLERAVLRSIACTLNYHVIIILQAIAVISIISLFNLHLTSFITWLLRTKLTHLLVPMNYVNWP
jgi:hypothetical protein